MGDRDGVVRQSANNLVASVEQPVSERHFALLQVPVLDGPDRSSTLAEPFDRGFRDQQGLRELHGPDVDLRLFAEVEAVGYAVERDLYPTFFIDAIAFRFDPGNLSLKSLLGRDRRTNSTGSPTWISPALLSSI